MTAGLLCSSACWRFIFVAWPIGWLACACNGSDGRYFGRAELTHSPTEFRYNLGSEPEWLDPGLATDSASGVVLTNIFAGLTQLDPRSLEPMPDIAESWKIDHGGTRYRFKLRQSTWSDGKALTANDFVFAFQRVLNPAFGSRYASFLYPFLHAEAIHAGALRLGPGLPQEVNERHIRRWASVAAPVKEVRLDRAEGCAYLFFDNAAVGRSALSVLQNVKLRHRSYLLRLAAAQDLGVRALSDYQLEIRVEHPVPYLLSVLAFYTAMPVPKHVLQDLESRGIESSRWTRPEHLVSNGAYLMTEWQLRRHILLDKNPKYWASDEVRTPRVRLTLVDSANTTLNLYKAGEIDHVGQSALPAEFVRHLERFEDFRRGPALSVYYLWLNTRQAPLDDVRIRRALSLAVDRRALVQHVTRGGQLPTADLVPDGLAGYRGLGKPQFDPARARALLLEAGYGPDNPLPPVTYRYNTSEGHKQVAEAIQQMWREHLGVDVRLENQEWRVYLKSMQAGEFMVARAGWVADYPDPNTFLELLLSGSGNNHSGWGDRRFDELLRQANSLDDRESRLAFMHDAENLALEAQPIVPLYVYTHSQMVKPYVRGAYLNAQGRVTFKHVTLTELKVDASHMTPGGGPAMDQAGPP